MKKIFALVSIFILNTTVHAVTIYGELGNFDVVNDTGVETHGFEIELNDVTSTQIGATYDYSHYGQPTIIEDDSVPDHPKTFIRYQATYDDVTGKWSAYTTFPINGLPPTQGHQCTDPSVNLGCEHFAASSYPIASSMTYSWLIEDSNHPGTLIRAQNPTIISAPNWIYSLPDPEKPAKVIAVLPAPEAHQPNGYQFGTPSFVKVIKTKSHNVHNVRLDQLIGGDKDGDGQSDWANKETQEVESEFYLLQKGNNRAKAEHHGKAEQLNVGDNITRRYEFYKYTGSNATLDGETNEAMCDEVGSDGIHGKNSRVLVSDANGNSYIVDCTQEIIVGNYVGANMVGFEAFATLGLVEHIEDGQVGKAYVPRSLAFGGNTPYQATVTGSLPDGLAIDSITGILTGVPNTAGVYTFTVNVIDSDNTLVSQTYIVNILDINGKNAVNGPVITTNSLLEGTELATYYFALTATAGTQPLSWSTTDLPIGLSLSYDGVLSGIPLNGTAGNSTPTITVTDYKNQSYSKTFNLKIK